MKKIRMLWAGIAAVALFTPTARGENSHVDENIYHQVSSNTSVFTSITNGTKRLVNGTVNGTKKVVNGTVNGTKKVVSYPVNLMSSAVKKVTK